MRHLRSLWFRMLALFRRRALETEMNAELQAHLDGLTDRYLASGMTPVEARRAAQRDFGGLAQIQERSRESRRILWLENVTRDAGFAWRSLSKAPSFTAITVLTLALGLGVNTALFTWFNAAAFRPLPVSEPDQLYSLTRLDANGRETKAVSYADFVLYRDHQTTFSGLAASAGVGVELADPAEFLATNGERTAELRIETVSPSYFSVLAVPMMLGRPLVPSDETSSDALPVIVLSHRFWVNQLASDPEVIGRTLRLRGLADEVVTVVGISAPDFHGIKPGAPAGWVPLLMRRGERWRSEASLAFLTVTGRLRPGVSPEHASEEIRSIAGSVRTSAPENDRSAETITLTKASTYLNLTAQHLVVLLPMIFMFGAVLLASVVNASNLILARAMTRQFEFAVRSALGASRRRLLALIVTENVILGLLAGAVGWALAAAMLKFVWPWLLDMMPDAREGTAGLVLTADVRVFGFTLAVSILAGALGGLLPAWHVTRRNVLPALNQEGSAFGRRIRISRVRSVLAVAQLALSAMLVFTAGLLVQRSLQATFRDVGFDKSRLVTFELLAPRAYSAAQLDAARSQLLERLKGHPEVAEISQTTRFPFSPTRTTIAVDDTAATADKMIIGLQLFVPADYLSTLQLPLIRGRFFGWAETPMDRTVVVSETAARALWPDTDPLGQQLYLPTTIETAQTIGAVDPKDVPRSAWTVVGIVRDTRAFDPWSGERPLLYLLAPTGLGAAPYLLIRTRGAADQAIPTFRQIGRDVTGEVPRISTVDDLFAGVLTEYRMVAWVAVILGVLSLIVAVTGLYGVMTFAVTQRVKEIGIRVALGASPRRVASQVVVQAMRLMAVGAALGFGLSAAIAVWARTLLLGVSAFNPVACGFVALVLALIGLLACWLPARRASRVDPVVALRAE